VSALESGGKKRGLVNPQGYWRSSFLSDPIFIPVARQALRNAEGSSYAVHMFGELSQKIDDQLVQLYHSFSGKEKSFYKTCQAASYLLDWCEMSPPQEGTLLVAGACAIFGLEALESRFENGRVGEPLRSLAEVYPRLNRHQEEDAWASEQNTMLKKILLRLYRVLAIPPSQNRSALEWIRSVSENRCDRTLDMEGAETFWGKEPDRGPSPEEGWHPDAFCNPASSLEHPVIAKALEGYRWFDPNADRKTFRDLHADALRCGFFRMGKPKPAESSSAENFSLTFALAHPGAGKTTTVIRTLGQESAPCLFLYASPRVSINDSVVGQIQEKLGERQGIAITTNATIQQYAEDFQHKGGVVTYENWDGPIPRSGSVGYVPMADMERVRAQGGGKGSHGRESGFSVREDTERRRAVARIGKRVPPVLKTLFDGAAGLVRNRKELAQVQFFLASVSLQAFRFLKRDHLSKFLRDVAEDLQERCDADGSLRPRIVVMLDEVTGSSEGLEIVRMVIQGMRTEAHAYPQVDFHVVVADASLVNIEVLEDWLHSTSGDFPACVLRDTGGTQIPAFRRIDWDVPEAPLYSGSTVVEASAYPAGRLTLHYRLRVDRAKLENGRKVSPRALRLSTLAETTVEAFRSCPPGEQVLVFVQDKNLLRDLMAVLEDALVLNEGQIRILSAEVGPKERRALLEDGGTTVRIVLMTSAGSRGLDFPKVSRYVINVNRFAPESTLLEVQQVLFRGRGGGCDGLDRDVWFVLSDELPEDLPTEQTDMERAFRRFLFDHLSMLALLRATLLTRATGRSWMDREIDDGRVTDTVVCPLGETGQSERETPLVSLFLDVLRAVDVLTQKGVLQYEHKASFYQMFFSLFQQDTGRVYIQHDNVAQTIWLDHPILGLLDPQIRSVSVENGGVHPASEASIRETGMAFLLNRKLVRPESPRSILQHQGKRGRAVAWIRGPLCILEVDSAHLKVVVPQSRADLRQDLRDLAVAFLKEAQESRQERVGDHVPALRDFARLLERPEMSVEGSDQEDYGKDPGKVLIITPLVPPHVQSDPDSGVLETAKLPWTSWLLAASGILDSRDKRRWPMIDEDSEPDLNSVVPMEPEKPFVLVFSTSTGRPLRKLRRLQTTRGFDLLAAALPDL
jgi:hypothetical protein